MKYKKINNSALEVIMRDVLHGVADFTRETSCACLPGKLEITAVERSDENQQATALILPFPGSRQNPVKK